MKSKHFSRAVAIVLAVMMLVSVLPLSVFATIADWEENNVVFDGTSFGTNGYYNVISKKDYTLVPGAATETEMVINNSTGTRRQVMHIIELDPSNPDVSVLPGYYGIDKYAENPSDTSNWKAAGVTNVAAYYEDVLGYNVVGAMNTGLAYDCNAPYSWLVYNGEVLVDAKNGINNAHSGACQTMLCVYKDATTGECSVELRTATQGLRGDEWQAIGANFAMTVNNGVLVNKSENHSGGSDDAARSMVGVKEDGTLVLVMNDGRGSNNSKGFCSYELGESMLSLGCKWAFNCDGGGSSSFVTKRAGEEDLVCRCVPCDGAERPTINSVIIVSNVGATGVLDKVNIEADYDIFAPSTTYTFGTKALDTHGYAMDLPAEATWALSDDTFGTIENGTFVSNGKLGDVTVQVKLSGEIIGEKTITVANPTTLGFAQDSTTLPYGKSTTLAFTSLIGEAEVYLDGNSFDFSLSNNGGTLNGLTFTAGNDESIAKTVVTATYKAQNKVLTYTINFGKGSEILWDFEDGIDGWWGYDETVDYLYSKGYIKEKSYKALNDYYNGTGSDNFSECVKTTTFAATAENGYVHNGNGALGVKLDFTQVTFNDWCYGVLFTANGGVLRDVANNKKAITLGMWIRLPDDDIQAAGKWCNQLTVWKGTDKEHLSGGQIHFQYTKPDGSKANIASIDPSHIPENRWMYVTAALPSDNYVQLPDKDSSLYRSPSFSRSYIKPNIASELTFYMDDITLDYSSAVDDRVPPTISNPQYSTSDTSIAFTNGVTITEVSAAYTATIADNGSGIDASTAQIYIDGNKVTTQVAGNTMFCDNVSIGVGTHKVKFEIADNLGNFTTLTRTIVSETTDHYMKYRTRLELAGHNDSGETPMPGSVYYIDVTSSYADNFGTAVFTLELNTANTWILDAIQAADGYDVTYVTNSDTPNKVTFTVTSPKSNSSTKVILSIPVRVYNPELQATSEATPQAISGRSFTAALNVKMQSCTYAGSYGNYSEFSIAAFATNRVVTRHEHTEHAVADKAAELGVAGYTGRTYCDECQSIVDFGTIIPAIIHTHSYELVDGQFVCSDPTCGEVYNAGTGLFEMNGKNYYAIAGNLLSGWQQIEDDFYYFDATTLTTIDSLNNGHVTYEFDESGKLVEGKWETTEKGRRYWYGPTYYRITNGISNLLLVEIDGVTYGLQSNGYTQSGIQLCRTTTNTPLKLYSFADNGEFLGFATAIYNSNYYLDGVKVGSYYGLVKYEGNFYYIDSDAKIVRSQTKYLTTTNNLTFDGITAVPHAKYDFDADGKMIVKNGPCDDGYFYINGVKQLAYQLVEFEGNYYYISDYNKYVTGKTKYLSAERLANTSLSAGNYSFDETGKMIIKNGPWADGYFYINGVKQLAYQLVEFEGNYYYISDYNKYVTGKTKYLSAERLANTSLSAGNYSFDETGKLIVKNGPWADGYFYIGGVKQLAYQLVEFEGNYYYISDNNKYVTGKTKYLSATRVAGTSLTAGNYFFDETGKLIID